jgi:AcrR family transcriptional regulator
VADETQDLDRLFERLAREEEAKGDPEEHPSVETLTAYHANELSPGENARIQEHLAACRRCAEIVLDFDSFLAAPAGEPEVASFEEAAEWRRLRERIREEGAVPEAKRASIPASWKTAYALAAVLFLAVVGLSFYSLSLRRELEQSVSGLKILTLNAGDMRGEEPEIHAIRLPHLLEIRVSPAGPAYPEYRVEVMDSGGRRLHDMSIGEEGDLGLTILLPKRFLPPGNYRFELFGVREGQREPLARHVVRVLP